MFLACAASRRVVRSYFFIVQVLLGVLRGFFAVFCAVWMSFAGFRGGLRGFNV